MKIVKKKIADLIGAEYNPRELTEKQHSDLTDSLKRFGIVDPVLVNVHPERENIIIGGHQRTKVWGELGNKEIDCVELKLTLDEEKELNIRLNKNTGQFNMDDLANFFDEDKLIEWGFETYEFGFLDEAIEEINEEEKNEEGEVKFSEFLNEKNNYVVLFFDNEMDWLQAQTHFNLSTVKSKRQNGKEWSKGIGRVKNGAKYLKELKYE